MKSKILNIIIFTLIVIMGIVVCFQYQFIKKQIAEADIKTYKVNITNKMLIDEIDKVLRANTIYYVNITQIPINYRTDTSTVFLVVKFPICEACVYSTLRALQKYALGKSKRVVVLSDEIGIPILKKHFYFEKINVPVVLFHAVGDFTTSLSILIKRDDNYVFMLPLPVKSEAKFVNYHFNRINANERNRE